MTDIRSNLRKGWRGIWKEQPEEASTVIFNIVDFGAVGDGIQDDTAAIQDAINSASSSGGAVFIPKGIFRITATLTYGAPMYGLGSSYLPDFPGGAVSGGSILLVDGISGAVISIDNQDHWALADFAIDGQQNTCTGIAAVNTANRYSMGNIFVYECATAGFDLDGLIGIPINCFASQCGTGVVISSGNASTLIGGESQGYTVVGLDIANTTESLHIAGFTSEGGTTVTGAIGVRVAEGCEEISLSNMYIEGNPSGYHLDVAWGGTGNMVDAIGGVTLANLRMNTSYSPHAELRFGNIGALTFLNTSYDGPVRFADTCRSVTGTILSTPENFGGVGFNFSRFQQIVDSSNRLGRPVENWCINPHFAGSGTSTMRGFDAASYGTNVTSSLETSASICRSGATCLKVTTASAATSQYEFIGAQFLNQAQLEAIFNATNTGATRRLAMTGWIRLATSAVYAIGGAFDPSIGLVWRNDGSADTALVLTGTTHVDSPGLDRWQRFVVWADIELDGSTYDQFGWGMFTRPGAAQDGIALGANAILYLDDFCVAVDPQSIEDMLSGRYAQESPAGKMLGGALHVRGTASSDVDIAHAVGDTYWDAAPISGGTMGSVCTTAGTGATAVFKTFGAIA